MATIGLPTSTPREEPTELSIAGEIGASSNGVHSPNVRLCQPREDSLLRARGNGWSHARRAAIIYRCTVGSSYSDSQHQQQAITAPVFTFELNKIQQC